jgi:predicted lipid-binding transport protein (Tim44 family)
MRNWLLAAGIVVLGGVLVVPDVEARRIGGGRNLGAQRNVTAPPAKPAQQQAAQGQQQGAQPAATGSRWAPILGGLALGGILGYLMWGNGLGGILLLAALAAVAFLVVRALAARRQEQQVQYAGMRGTASVPLTPQLPASARPARVPAGFDAAGFLRAAKMNFLKLQAANDAGRLEEIREFTTDELYEALRRDVGAKQHTEITGLDADLLELVEEGDRHWASVRFTGSEGAEAFVEVWNLVKPADGSSGWLLAGIQQMH